MRYLIYFLCVVFSNTLQSSQNEPDYLIGGLVNPLSGHLSIRETDMVVNGAQKLVVNRIYNPIYMPCAFPKEDNNYEARERLALYHHVTQNYKGWEVYPHLKLHFSQESKEILITDRNGMSLNFYMPNSKTILLSHDYTCSNMIDDIPSGRYDPRNTKISHEGDTIIVYATDGSVQFYLKKNQSLFLLNKEKLPNGKIIKYHYTNNNLSYVESLDPNERFVYASIRIDNNQFVSSSGDIAKYDYITKKTSVEIKKKSSTWRSRNRTEEYHFPVSPPILSSTSTQFYKNERLKYNDRFLLCNYSGKSNSFVVEHCGFGKGLKHYRINKLSLPIGPTYELSYNPAIIGFSEGTTTVKNSDGTSVIYNFSKNLLTTSIQYFGEDGELEKEKIYSWSGNNWLNFIEMKNGNGELLYKKSYDYDDFGNPILELFSGDLTGSGAIESFSIKRKFSNRFLILEEKHADGKTINFDYLPNTNIVISKITKEDDKIVLTERFIYDECNNLIQTIVNQKITTYTLRQSPPFLHMPEWIEEIGVKKSHLIYDEKGNVAQEEVYDINNNLAYTIYRTYNECGYLLSESNRSGQIALYTYNEKGDKETSTNFSKRIYTIFNYDARGRLIKQEEIGDDGVIHTTTFEYDSNDRLVCKKDPHATHYTYINRTKEIKSLLATDLLTYDHFGRKITDVDSNGNVTTYRYNAYDSPVEIVHPDGQVEKFFYSKNGMLSSYTNSGHPTIFYKRDIFGRILSKKYLIAEERFIYDAFNLLSETNKEGNTKNYTYDECGRKIKEEFCGRITEFSYNPIGQLATICEHNGDNTLIINYKRDLEGRIVEECKGDLYKILYSYDGDGNKKTITTKSGTIKFKYDSFNRLIEKTDKKNYTTKIIYDEDYTNKKTLQITTIDPNGISTIETKDALDRTIKKEIINDKGTIACQEMVYDSKNLLYQKDHIYNKNQFQNTQTIKYTYASNDQLESVIRGCDEDQRATTYTYIYGDLSTKTLPNGVTLSYKYNSLGFMTNLDSSDDKIHHLFDYNKLGHLISASDGKISIKRIIDNFGNVIHEFFPSNLDIKKNYDNFNRLISLKIADQGDVFYEYDPIFLRKIIRSNKGNIHTHTYEKYDEDGSLISENLIKDLGEIIYSTSPNGEKTSISTPYFSQKLVYDSVGNLITNITDGNEVNYTYDDLSQLNLEDHDSLYRTIDTTNNLNELSQYQYDLNGNQITKENATLIYDALNRLIEATVDNKKITFTYDPIGRRLTKTVGDTTENYIYNGEIEIGSFVDNKLKNLKILGGQNAIAIEIDGKPFVPIVDVQGNIRRLIDPETKTIVDRYDFTPFGISLITEIASNPWRFASKRFDQELNLVYFGNRYYDPQSSRWLTIDPAQFRDSSNLYQYVFNNPFKYTDPDRRYAIALPILAWGTRLALIPLTATLAAPIAATILTGAALYGGCKLIQYTNNLITETMLRDSYTNEITTNNYFKHYLSEEESDKDKKKNSIGKNFPDRSLPRDEKTNEPKPDVNSPHTQLGKKMDEMVNILKQENLMKMENQ